MRGRQHFEDLWKWMHYKNFETEKAELLVKGRVRKHETHLETGTGRCNRDGDKAMGMFGSQVQGLGWCFVLVS